MPATAKAAKLSLASIYDELESILAGFSPPFTGRDSSVRGKRSYVLVSEKEVVFQGHKKPEMWFAGIIEQKSYIGFYYMPIYCITNMVKPAPGLMKLLKGKSCFYIKTLTPELKKDVASALRAGLTAYKKQGWL
ncbi:MAG TPA: hypothetical protein VF135_13700 [Terriglobales bacterium]